VQEEMPLEWSGIALVIISGFVKGFKRPVTPSIAGDIDME